MDMFIMIVTSLVLLASSCSVEGLKCYSCSYNSVGSITTGETCKEGKSIPKTSAYTKDNCGFCTKTYAATGDIVTIARTCEPSGTGTATSDKCQTEKVGSIQGTVCVCSSKDYCNGSSRTTLRVSFWTLVALITYLLI